MPHIENNMHHLEPASVACVTDSVIFPQYSHNGTAINTYVAFQDGETCTHVPSHWVKYNVLDILRWAKWLLIVNGYASCHRRCNCSNNTVHFGFGTAVETWGSRCVHYHPRRHRRNACLSFCITVLVPTFPATFAPWLIPLLTLASTIAYRPLVDYNRVSDSQLLCILAPHDLTHIHVTFWTTLYDLLHKFDTFG